VWQERELNSYSSLAVAAKLCVPVGQADGGAVWAQRPS
jgi:hypothetical protein